MGKLAINGGIPLLNAETGVHPLVWPIRDQVTAQHLLDVYFSGKWSFNSETEQKFEEEFAAAHDAKYGIYMANGTVTLQCALDALGIGAGDEVIVPGLTWVATAMSAYYLGAKVVFADIDPETMTLSPEAFENAITPKTKAVIPVHLYGSMADLEKIIAIADKHGIAVIEDCAHMHGGKWAGKGAGSWGKVGSFSFQQSKTIASGEGGICLTNDEKLAELIYRCKHIGYSRFEKQGAASSKPPQGMPCYNFRGLAFTAQILRDQLPGMNERLAIYQKFYDILAKETADIEGFRLQKTGRLATFQGFYATCMFFEGPRWEKIPAKRISEAIHAEGASIYCQNYGPVKDHLLFNMRPGEYSWPEDGAPNTYHVWNRSLVFPHQEMFDLEFAPRLASVIRKISDNISEL